MADFVLVIANTKTAYDAFLTARAAAVAAVATRAALTAPTKPTVCLVDADWNGYLTSLSTYNAAVVTADASVVSTKATQHTAELAVIATFGYIAASGTPYTAGTTCLDEWIKVVGAGAGILTYTNYIGAATSNIALVISTTLPTQAFPNT